GGTGGTGGAGGVGGAGGTGGAGGAVRDCMPPDVLIPFSATWKYLDDNVDPGQAWRAKAFKYSAWKEGPARIGFDTTVETATKTNDNGGPPTTLLAMYLRNHFEMTCMKACKSLKFELIVDDGAVMYLNGTEVARDNLPPGELMLSDTAIEGHY